MSSSSPRRNEVFSSDGPCLICPGRVPFKDSDGWSDHTCPHSIAENEQRAEENRIRRLVREEMQRHDVEQ